MSDAATDAPSPALRPEPFVSLVIPVFNEEEVLPLLLSRLEAIGQELPGGFEAVFVDDGSRDASARILAEANGRDPRVKLVQLSRNFGQAAAMTAGLDHVRGDVVVLMDADLQDPPELVPRMVRLYREGFDVVHARRASRRAETWFKRWTAWLFYRLMGIATAGGLRADVGEFRLMSREVTEALGSLREQHRLLRGLVAWVGFRQTTLDFERPGRAAGLTKFPVRRMLEQRVGGPILVSRPEMAYFLAGQPSDIEGSSFYDVAKAGIPGSERVLERLERREYTMIAAMWPLPNFGGYTEALRDSYTLTGACQLRYYFGVMKANLAARSDLAWPLRPPPGTRCTTAPPPPGGREGAATPVPSPETASDRAS